MAVAQAEVALAQAHDMIAGLEPGDADQLAYQGLADEDLSATPRDLAGAAPEIAGLPWQALVELRASCHPAPAGLDDALARRLGGMGDHRPPSTPSGG